MMIKETKDSNLSLLNLKSDSKNIAKFNNKKLDLDNTKVKDYKPRKSSGSFSEKISKELKSFNDKTKPEKEGETEEIKKIPEEYLPILSMLLGFKNVETIDESMENLDSLKDLTSVEFQQLGEGLMEVDYELLPQKLKQSLSEEFLKDGLGSKEIQAIVDHLSESELSLDNLDLEGLTGLKGLDIKNTIITVGKKENASFKNQDDLLAESVFSVDNEEIQEAQADHEKVNIGTKDEKSKAITNRIDEDILAEEELGEDSLHSTEITSLNIQESRPDSLIIRNNSAIKTDYQIEANSFDDMLVNQVVEKLEVDINEVKQEIIIQLKPESLGKVNVNMEIEDGKIVAKLMVENYKTKEALENNINILIDDLEETGMEIKSFEVFVGNNSDFERHGQSGFNFFNQKQRRFKQGNKNIKLKNIVDDYEVKTIDSDRSSLVTDSGMDLLV